MKQDFNTLMFLLYFKYNFNIKYINKFHIYLGLTMLWPKTFFWFQLKRDEKQLSYKKLSYCGITTRRV